VCSGLPLNSDRGSVYTSADYRKLVAELGMRSSMGRTGVGQRDGRVVLLCVEERTRLRTVYATKAQARRDVIAYIEGFYNSRRRHSALGYKSPNEVHYSYVQPATAA
jgi:putative transposase